MTDAWDRVGGGLIYRPICLTDGGDAKTAKSGREYCPDCRAWARRWAPH